MAQTLPADAALPREAAPPRGAAKAGKRQLLLRLVHSGSQPGPAATEPVRFGVQDTKGNVHPGSGRGEGGLWLDATVDVIGIPGQGEPVFGGMFCQGPRGGRFLYLSWKREGDCAAPWAWRIKVPLSDITWAMVEEAAGPGRCLLADVGHRRPHVVEPVEWRVARSG